MLFSDLYKSPRSPLSKLRSSPPQYSSITCPDYDADLVSKDKARQKEAVKRHLAEKVRNDWEFPWPPIRRESVVASSHPEDTPTTDTVADEGETTAAPTPGAGKLHPGPQTDAHVDHLPDNATCAPALDATADCEGNAVFLTPVGEQHEEAAAGRDWGDEAESESGTESGLLSDADSVYTTISEDADRFRSRAEWTSDLSDEDLPRPGASPFRFDSPDAVGTAVQSSFLARRAKRRRALREEATWNDGLACFTARRDAWTGARTVRVKPKPPSPVSPSSPRRFFWRPHTRAGSTSSSAATTPAPISASAPGASFTSPLSPATTRHSHHSQPSDTAAVDTTPPSSEPDVFPLPGKDPKKDSRSLYPVETVVPVPPPLIPPENPMRASVGPNIYPSLYDKVVVNGLQPSCPINLGDMVRSCVVGWKRDGEWPPRPSEPLFSSTAATAAAAAVVVVRRRKDKPPPPTPAPGAAAAASPAPPTGAQSRRGSAATSGGGRRMSLVGLLDRVGLDRDKDKEKDKKGDDQQRDPKEARTGATSEDPGSTTGKAIRRSLQKVFNLGHAHAPPADANPEANSPPISPKLKEEKGGQ